MTSQADETSCWASRHSVARFLFFFLLVPFPLSASRQRVTPITQSGSPKKQRLTSQTERATASGNLSSTFAHDDERLKFGRLASKSARTPEPALRLPRRLDDWRRPRRCGEDAISHGTEQNPTPREHQRCRVTRAHPTSKQQLRKLTRTPFAFHTEALGAIRKTATKIRGAKETKQKAERRIT